MPGLIWSPSRFLLIISVSPPTREDKRSLFFALVRMHPLDSAWLRPSLRRLLNFFVCLATLFVFFGSSSSWEVCPVSSCSFKPPCASCPSGLPHLLSCLGPWVRVVFLLSSFHILFAKPSGRPILVSYM